MSRIFVTQALDVSTDELLGLAPRKRATKLGSRLERRLRQIEQLGPRPRKQLVQIIDTFIEAEQLKQKAGA